MARKKKVKRRRKIRQRKISKRFKVLLVVATITVGIVLFLAIDLDGDGLSNITELQYGASMFDSDTDGDGLSDGLEVNTYGTKLLVSDTDNDGLNDGAEVNTYGTEPLVKDSDNDGLDDGTEVLGNRQVFELTSSTWSDGGYSWTLEHKVWDGTRYWAYYSWQGDSWTWPYDRENVLMDNSFTYATSDPSSIDTDGDGLNDKREYEIGTNPRSKDTDNDGLDDIAEFTAYKTIPQFYDTDGDLLGDGEEINMYTTNPLNWDSDNDHLSDGIEAKGYDVDGDNKIDVDFPAYGANPLVKDIFVEIDRMPPGKTLGSYAKGKLVEVFAEHGIVLHLDQGELGGGSETRERVNIIYDNKDGPWNDLYDFSREYFTASRVGVFYWCLITTSELRLRSGEEVGGLNFGDRFTVAGTWTWDGGLGSAFMHELGHGLGLNCEDFDGIDSDKYSFSEYRSVMNYNNPSLTTYGGEFFNYSEGPPFNDWEHINFEWLWGRNYRI